MYARAKGCSVEEMTVFVDDAVLGNFSPICVKHGERTSDVMVLSRPIGFSNLGVAWLLVLAGPVGIVILVIISALRGRDDLLKVRLPCCGDVVGRYKLATRWRRVTAGATIVLAILAAVAGSHGAAGGGAFLTATLSVAALLALAETVHEALTCRRLSVGIELDASRRWVTLKGVHPAFTTSALAEDDHRSSRSAR